MKMKTVMRDNYASKSGALTTPNAGKDVEQPELSLAADGSAEWHRTDSPEDSPAVSYKTKHILAL